MMEQIKITSMGQLWIMAALCGLAGTALGILVIVFYSIIMGVI